MQSYFLDRDANYIALGVISIYLISLSESTVLICNARLLLYCIGSMAA